MGRPAYPTAAEEELEPPTGLVVVGVEGGGTPTPPEVPRAEPRPRRPEEIEVIQIAPAATPTEPEPLEREPGAEPAEVEEEGPFLTNAERLRPQFSRVWIDPRARPLYGERLARYARADSAVRAILSVWLDSIALSDEERRKAVDWTFGEGDERWGISPEGLHLGKITIPIPFGFGMNGPERRELEQALRDLQEIQRQNLQADLEENRRERVQEMRKRTEEELDRRRGERGGAAGDSAKQDTTARRDTARVRPAFPS